MPCHYQPFKIPSSACRSTSDAPSMTPMDRSFRTMEESSLFSLLLPSFDYLVNPQRQGPQSPVVSVVKPRSRSNSAPSNTTTSSTPALVPILRKRSSSQLSAARGEKEGASQHPGSRDMSHSASESSDLPSLTSSSSSDSLMAEDDPETSRHSHDSGGGGGRAVSFCSRVWVRVFERSQRERDCIWYSPRDMAAFKVEALERIQHYYSTCQTKGERLIVPTETGKAVSTSCPAQRLLFSHEALQADCEVLSATTPLPQTDLPIRSEEDEAANKIERILVVDPHEVCLSLLSQAFRLMFPLAVVQEARSSTDALALVGPNERFDVIVVEERLNRVGKANDLLGSGSTLMAGIRGELRCDPLFIGVTSHPEEDAPQLQQHGADVVWSKPPQSINLELRSELLRTLSLKRGHERVEAPS